MAVNYFFQQIYRSRKTDVSDWKILIYLVDEFQTINESWNPMSKVAK